MRYQVYASALASALLIGSIGTVFAQAAGHATGGGTAVTTPGGNGTGPVGTGPVGVGPMQGGPVEGNPATPNNTLPNNSANSPTMTQPCSGAGCTPGQE